MSFFSVLHQKSSFFGGETSDKTADSKTRKSIISSKNTSSVSCESLNTETDIKTLTKNV